MTLLLCTQVLTLYYLDVLVKSLMRLDLHPLTLPVFYLELLIALTTLSNEVALSKLLHMRYVYITAPFITSP